MKKYIFIALAAAGTMACSKLTPVDSIPVTELPEDETTETVAPKKGETITIQLAQTKVTLDKTVYVFEGNEQIVVKAGSDGPVATISNSTEDPYTFTGVFETPLGKENPSFDFYYNCTDASGKPNYEQNGQPWLEHKGVTATRATDGGYAYYVVERVQLRQPKGYVALAISSGYDCTVSFNTLQKDPQTVGKTIEGIAVSAGKPYFVNVSKEDLTEGFYLAVNKKGETGTMYTSYGTATTISKNTTIKIKDFTPLSITGELCGFNTSYSIYTDSSNANRVADANSVSNDYMSRGSLTLRIAGISNSLLSLVSLKSITIRSSDGVLNWNTDSQPYWDNKTYTWSFGDATYNHPWGQLTVTATAVFDTPAGQITATVPEQTRYITGLPYRAPSEIKFNDSSYKWTSGMTNVSISADKVHLEGAAFVGPKAYSPAFKVPKETSVNINCSVTKSSAGSSRYTFELKRSNGSQNDVTYVSEKGTTTEYTISNASLTTEYCKLYAFYSYTSTHNYMEITKMNITYR